MDLEYWRERWQKNEIGFHQESVSPLLQNHWSQCGISAGGAVLVPLCGKSLDMLWLASLGYHVIGVELSDVAVRAFWQENSLLAERRVEQGCEVWQGSSITIIVADIFQLSQTMLPPIQAVYDRAALVALPPARRAQYIEQLHRLSPMAVMLLLTVEYAEREMEGPPFPVFETELRQWFPGLQCLHRQDVLENFQRFKAKGVTALNEAAYRIDLQGMRMPRSTGIKG